MTKFQYCPHCKSDSLQFSDNKVWKCQDCHFVLYHNVAGATAVLLYKEKSILFTVRNENPQKGMLDLPGGFIDPNESVEEGIQRELEEELSIQIAPRKLEYVGSQPNVYLYKDIPYNTIDLYFTYPLTAEELSYNQDEIQELIWIPVSDIPLEKLAFESHRQFFTAEVKKLLW